MKKILFGIILSVMNYQNHFAQTLDQQLRNAQQAGQITSNEAKKLATTPSKATNISGLKALNKAQFFKEAPDGISSLFVLPDLIEEVSMGNLTVFYPKGYGKNVLHYGIWNAIPFVVFDNNSLELRLGLIFEHRQVGFVPDDWVSSSLTGIDLPEISFLIPDSKTFLNFTHGSSQWRSTVLLTEEQISNLSLYANNPNSDPEANIFTVNHRFADSSSRPYLIGLRHKGFFKILLQIYNHISSLPLVQKFRSSDAFPAGAFFEELTIQNVTTDTLEIQQAEVIEPSLPTSEPTPNTPDVAETTDSQEDEPGYEYDITSSYVYDETAEGDYDDAEAEASYDDAEASYDDAAE